VIEEIELRYHQGFRAIDFEDDNLTFYKPEMKELCRRLIARFPNKEMEFVAMNGISYLSLDQELLELMWQAGFTQLNLALVTSDKSVRESTKRPHTVEKYIAVVEAAIALGFKIVSYQILGLPGESLGSMIQTLQFNARFPVLLGASNFYLTPESPIAKNFPPQTKQDFKRARLTAMAIESEEIKRDTVNTLFITTRIINFLKGLPIKQNEEQSLSNILENPSALVWERPMLPREILGLELLQKLLQEQVLYKSTKKGLKANHHFSWEIFWSVWSGIKKMALLNKAILNIHLDDVETQEGSAISLEQGPIALSQ